jgi:hypothetical protein
MALSLAGGAVLGSNREFFSVSACRRGVRRLRSVSSATAASMTQARNDRVISSLYTFLYLRLRAVSFAFSRIFSRNSVM